MDRQILRYKKKRLTNYFSRTYPKRNSILGKLLFRHGEYKRRQAVSKWISSTKDFSILDMGCGDGLFLYSIIKGKPSSILLEDISPNAIKIAYENLKGKAKIVEKKVCNSMITNLGNFDLVLAVGILDYYKNWDDCIKKILLRTKGCLVLSVPRIDSLRNWIRFFWLLLHGINLRMVFRSQLNDTIGQLTECFEIQKTRFEWFILICKS